MNPKQLRALGRSELLEMLLQQSRETEELTAKVEQMTKDLSERSETLAEREAQLQAQREDCADGKARLEQQLQESRAENETLVQQLSSRDAEIARLEEQLADKTLRINKAGSIAEAALSLNGMFEAAEASCIQYVENIRRLDARQAQVREELLAETRRECQQMRDQTRADCDKLREETDAAVEAQWAQISGRLLNLYDSHQGLMELVDRGMNLVPRGRGADNGEKNEYNFRDAYSFRR